MTGFDSKKLAIVVGMPRGGTTSLYHIVDTHPDCFAPYRKETSYFSYNYAKGADWYRDLFAERPDSAVAFDISPQYFMDLRAIERIKAFAPDAKIILSVRDPVDWIASLYFQINKFEHKPKFADFVDGFTVTGAYETLHCSFADGYVPRAIEAFRSAFGSRLLIFDFEALRKNPLEVLAAIEEFVGVPRYFNEQTYKGVKVNSVTQYNWRWLTWLASREAFITSLDSVLPRSAIRRGRTLVDRWTMPKPGSNQQALSDADLAIAEMRFGPDRDWVRSLFAAAPIQLGDGRPFVSKGKSAVGAELAAETAD